MSPVPLLWVGVWRWEAGEAVVEDAEFKPCHPSVRGSLSTGFRLPCSLPWSAEQGKAEVVRLWGSDLSVKDEQPL